MIISGIKRARFVVGSLSVVEQPPVAPPRELPEWITDSDLGSIDEEVEVSIPLSYRDPHASVTHFTASGDLPTGLYVNYFDGTINGIATVDVTESFNFAITMHSEDGSFTRNFQIHVLANDTEVVWKTTSDLGEVDTGAGFMAIISAEQVKK